MVCGVLPIISRWFFLWAEIGTFILNFEDGSPRFYIETEFCFVNFFEEEAIICSENSCSFSKLPEEESEGIDMLSIEWLRSLLR